MMINFSLRCLVRLNYSKQESHYISEIGDFINDHALVVSSETASIVERGNEAVIGTMIIKGSLAMAQDADIFTTLFEIVAFIQGNPLVFSCIASSSQAFVV